MIRKSCLKLIKKHQSTSLTPFSFLLCFAERKTLFCFPYFSVRIFFLLNLDLKRSFRRWKDSCGQQYTCNLLWKGFGRWTNSAWVPYIDGESWITIKNLNKFANSELPSNKGSNTDTWEIYKIRSKLKQNTPFSTRKKISTCVFNNNFPVTMYLLKVNRNTSICSKLTI